LEKKIDFKKYLVPVLMAVLFVLLILCAVLQRDEGRAQRKYKAINGLFNTAGTLYDYSGDSDGSFNENYKAALEILIYYNGIFDIYRDVDDVVGLYEINKNAGVCAVKVPTKLIEFLEFCKEVYTLTDGEVNVAMGAVLSLWHECREIATYNPQSAVLPDESKLIEASEHCDINNLIINREESTVYLSDAKMSLDVGAVGKGYAVEMAAKKLRELGAVGYVLDVGGNIRIIGSKPDGQGFKTGIKDPFDKDGGFSEILTLSDTSSATSGGYERYFTVGGERYHHIIDKDTLYPATKLASVTVITPNSGLADALSTALFCMDFEAGLALVESLPRVEAVFVKQDGSVVRSSGIGEFVNNN
jgi:thiamine biosynthesis lipoprotein